MVNGLDNDARRAVVKQLLDQRDALLVERIDVRAELSRVLARDQKIERTLNDIIAAGRLFGATIGIPGPTDMGAYASLTELTKRMVAMRGGKEWRPGECVPILETEPSLAASPGGTEQKDVPSTTGKSPGERVRDRVLDYLRQISPKGTKAAPIREHLFKVHAQPTHEKTVGMTLYRLLKEGAVRRDGHTWFYVPPEVETQNPGAVTPGLFNRDDKKGGNA